MDNKPNSLDEEEIAYQEAVGEVVLKSALMRYFQDLEAQKATAFTEYLQTNEMSESFLDDVVVAYPDFAKILREETDSFRRELGEVVPDTTEVT